MLRSPLIQTSAALAMLTALSPSASAETRSYDMEGFSALKASQSIEVIYTRSDSFSVRADVEDDDFDELIVETRGNTLTLKRPKQRGGWLRNRDRPEITVYVSAPTLSSVEISSSADFTGDTISGPRLTLAASSSGDIEIGSVSTGDLLTKASSSGTIELAGSCTSLDAKISSSGTVAASGLSCENADISASSSGEIEMDVAGGSVDLDLSSSGDADLTGTCSTIEVSASSGSDADARDLTCARLDARASSGAGITVAVTESVDASASSGADIDIYGSPTNVNERTSSGGDVDIHSAL